MNDQHPTSDQNQPQPSPSPEGDGASVASPAGAIAEEPERARVDWLKAIAVLVITIATVVILFKVVAYREEIADRLGFNPLRSSVQVFLRVTPEYADDGAGRGIVRLDVAGRATMQGEPLQAGVVRLTVEDVISQYYLGGDVLEIRPGERFEATLALSPDARGFRSSSVTVRAEVTGPHRGRTVSGKTELNIGYPRSFSHAVAWSLAGVAVVLVIVLICLFTGTIGPSKQRGLYMAMYTLVFASLAVPVVVSTMILQSSYLISIMEKAPVGLVRATSASSKSEPQWFINIGGIVTQRDETSTSPRPRDAKPAAREAEKGAVPVEGEAVRAAAKAVEARPAETRATNPLEISTSSRSSPYIEGGLAVPFYVVLLAMFGAGINLTRRVPEIQEEFRDFPAARRSSWFMKVVGEPVIDEDEQRRYTFAFRRALIQNFMYLLSAPFLAMAVYYLLQVVANEPARPILVLVAFATGLIADTLVNRIIRFAEDTLRLAPRHRAGAAIAAANARITQINAMVREEQAKLAEAIFLAEVARAHEDIAAARADRTKEMPDVPVFVAIEPIEDAQKAAVETHPGPEGEGGSASQEGVKRPPPGPEGT
ncbi:MAG TPA: hypothetical protein VHP37_25510 [Burkholderiales bacterium]|nr:hypothetical protein [Burkholderiales bacterium]